MLVIFAARSASQPETPHCGGGRACHQLQISLAGSLLIAIASASEDTWLFSQGPVFVVLAGADAAAAAAAAATADAERNARAWGKRALHFLTYSSIAESHDPKSPLRSDCNIRVQF